MEIMETLHLLSETFKSMDISCFKWLWHEKRLKLKLTKIIILINKNKTAINSLLKPYDKLFTENLALHCSIYS